MATIISRSPRETLELGTVWGREAKPGWVIAFTGDLGSGKTVMVRGLALGLGCPGRVQSPSYGLVQSHEGGRLPLWHLDLYRLEGVVELERAGLLECLQSRNGVVAVEWAERWLGADWSPAAPGPARGLWVRRVTIESSSATERRIHYEDPRT
jgi:tRNA threonylcarbamoyladenosine biosynthesis protein TsaE